MQSQESNTRTTGSLNHPDATEWMALLYAEVSPKRRRELENHLAHCADCSAQVQAWRASGRALDSWPLPAFRRESSVWMLPRPWWPVLRWAVAVGIVLFLGLAIGRQTSPGTHELAALKSSVAQLADALQRERDATLSNTVSVATAAANTETDRLLSEFARLQAEGRSADQQAVAVALRSFETRLTRLRAELETVALNTENGFEQTHENLTRLVSFSAPTGESSLK